MKRKVNPEMNQMIPQKKSKTEKRCIEITADIESGEAADLVDLTMFFYAHQTIKILPSILQDAISISYLPFISPDLEPTERLKPYEYLAKLFNREFKVLRP
jgi:hypothetical protein